MSLTAGARRYLERAHEDWERHARRKLTAKRRKNALKFVQRTIQRLHKSELGSEKWIKKRRRHARYNSSDTCSSSDSLRTPFNRIKPFRPFANETTETIELTKRLKQTLSSPSDDGDAMTVCSDVVVLRLDDHDSNAAQTLDCNANTAKTACLTVPDDISDSDLLQLVLVELDQHFAGVSTEDVIQQVNQCQANAALTIPVIGRLSSSATSEVLEFVEQQASYFLSFAITNGCTHIILNPDGIYFELNFNFTLPYEAMQTPLTNAIFKDIKGNLKTLRKYFIAHAFKTLALMVAYIRNVNTSNSSDRQWIHETMDILESQRQKRALQVVKDAICLLNMF